MIDIAVVGCASVMISPVLGMLAMAIKLDSLGSVRFKQKRVGKDREILYTTGKPMVGDNRVFGGDNLPVLR